MGIHTADLPVFLTRQDVANLLRLSPRQVDRLAADGTLTKQKLSASRSGFERSGVETYLRQMAGNGSGAPAGAPASPSAHDDFTMFVGPGGYSSSGTIMKVKLETDDGAVVAEALDGWLQKNGVNGCFIMGNRNVVTIYWAKSLRVDYAMVRKAVDAVKVTAVHAR
jgi:hypothetical protein